jgi:hypothetical protein
VPTFCDKLCDTDLEAIEAIRRACHGLLPNWQNPHRFFEQRSEITSGLTKLLRLLGNEPRPLNGQASRPDVLSHRVRVAGAIRLAEQTFTLHVPAATLQEPHDGLGALPAPESPASQPGAVLRIPRRSPRRHRYPLPPRGLNGQGILL